MLFHKLYDSRESHHLTGPNLDPRALLRMTAREGRALGNSVEYVTDSRNPEARTSARFPGDTQQNFIRGVSDRGPTPSLLYTTSLAFL